MTGPTSKLIRQILGAVAEFDKAMTVAKLKGARDRKRRNEGKREDRKSYAEGDPDMVGLAKEIKGRDGRVSLRDVAKELEAEGYVTPSGKRYSAAAIASMRFLKLSYVAGHITELAQRRGRGRAVARKLLIRAGGLKTCWTKPQGGAVPQLWALQHGAWLQWIEKMATSD
jgi:hypothetical protein